MSKASILFTTVAILLVVTNPVSGQPPTKPSYTTAICDTELGNYTTTEYEKNLITVLSTLLHQANLTSNFYSTSKGVGADTVYGQYYCRGDISSEFCGKCINNAAIAALVVCPKAKAAAVFFKECTLHYENQNMVGVKMVIPGVVVSSLSNVTDPTGFTSVLEKTMGEVVGKAVSDPSMFATGEGTISATETVYCLVQCSPDMDATQCQSCLESAAGVITRCCGQWPSLLYVFLPSCEMMYDTRAPFYFTSDAPPAAVSSSTPPAPERITRIPLKA